MARGTPEPVDGVGSVEGGTEREIDPAGITAGATAPEPAGEQPRRKRGRPPGAGTGKSTTGAGTRAAKSTAALDIDVKGLTEICVNIHMMLATVLAIPELGLTAEESEHLAKAVMQVSRHYSVPALAPKIYDHVNLGLALIVIYSPRVAAYRLRQTVEASQAANTTPPAFTLPHGAQTLPHGAQTLSGPQPVMQ